MNTEFSTSFWVFPEHANHNFPMIFGGAFFAELDKAAATCVRRFLYDSANCKDAVTYKFEGSFIKPCYVGDLIYLNAEIKSAGQKSIVVEVEAMRERPDISLELVGSAKFVFISLETGKIASADGSLPYAKHGLTHETST